MILAALLLGFLAGAAITAAHLSRVLRQPVVDEWSFPSAPPISEEDR